MNLDLLIPENVVMESLRAAVLFIYVMGVVMATKYVYHALTSRGQPHNVAVYYNRKIIHIFAGGVVALLVPFTFTSPTIPFILALVLALTTYMPHRTGKLMYWFQVKENMYEVNFCLMWGISLLILWLIFGRPEIAIIPPALMAFGDAVTGIVRNTLFKKRTKHWIGNVAMAVVSIPMGFAYAGLVGAFTGAVASVIERFEFNPIDDNILISLTSTIILIIAKAMSMI